MKTNILTMKNIFVLLSIFSCLWACEKDELTKNLKDEINIEYIMAEGTTAHAQVKTILKKNGKYSCQSFLSEEPATKGFITSFVIKHVNNVNSDEEVSVDKFNIALETGIISLKNNANLKPGTYTLDIKVSNANYTNVFPAAFTIDIIGDGLLYKNFSVLHGKSFVSSTPIYSGQLTNITYKLKNADKQFTINSKTGVISLKAGNSLKIAEYKLCVIVCSGESKEEFNNAICINIEDKINPPTDFTYQDVNVSVSMPISATPVFKGSNLVFSLEESCPKQLSINSNTGVISISEGSKLKIGKYTISVKAENSLASLLATFTITVSKKKILIPNSLVYATSDIKIFVEQEFTSVVPSIKDAENISYALENKSFNINSKTGQISLKKGNKLKKGIYILNVIVKHKNKNIVFAKALKIEILDKEIKPSDFSYDNKVINAGLSLKVQPSIKGSNVIFALDKNTDKQIHIDSKTGVIFINDKNTIAEGKYKILVTATNTIGSVSTSFALEVKSKNDISAPQDFAYSPAETKISYLATFRSIAPGISNANGVTYTINDNVNFSIDNKSGVISAKANKTLDAGIYELIITASNKSGSSTTNYKLVVMQIKYSKNTVEANIADGVNVDKPSIVNLEKGGVFVLRGVYFSGVINGKTYKDVLIEGGASKYVGDVIDIVKALKLENKKSFNTNLFRHWVGVPKNAKGKKGKGVWDGSIKIKKDVFIAGKYSLKIRYKNAGVSVDFSHAIDIVMK